MGLGDERYALAIDDVVEVTDVTTPTAVPGAPREVLGVQNIRGEVMPLLDVAALTGSHVGGVATVLVVVENAGRRAALAVDAALEVVELGDEVTVRPESAPLRSSLLLDGALVGVLDTSALMSAVKTESVA